MTTLLTTSVDALDRPSPQVLTLILQSFKNLEGFAAIDTVLEGFFNEAKELIASSEDEPKNDSAALLNLAMGGIKIILEFYSRVINSRYVNEAVQTVSMAPSSRQNRWETILAPQLLVELRKSVIGPAQKLWGESESSFMDKATTSIVKSLIEILRVELEGDSEVGATTKTDQVSNKARPEPKKWTPKSSDMLDKLTDEYGRDLAMEALFRCYDSSSSAREYCQAQKNHPRFARTPIPADEVESPNRSRSSPHRASTAMAGPSETDHDLVPGVPMLTGSSDEAMTDADLAQLERLVNIGMAPGEILAATAGGPLPRRHLQLGRGASASPGQDELVSAREIPGFVTVDDLNEDREKLRKTLINRCLDILNVHDDVTFELSDLISSAVSSKWDTQPSLRQEIASTLLSSLMSLQGAEDLEEEAARLQNKKIASYAHLLALVLQDEEFYNVIREELREHFCVLIDFVKLDHTQKSQDTSSFIGQVLLILERLLTDDATPDKIEYKYPDVENPIEEQSVAELKPGLISDDEKSQLFEAIVHVLPHIGKDDSLALSVCRVLVILTRSRPLALRLGETPNIGRLFTMAKQLHGVNSDRFQSAFLLVLRHVIEDDETIRNVMRSEIQATFENRSQRPLDTTTYTRTLYYLAIRSPQIFVQVTNEKVKILNYTNKHGPQQLALKKEFPAEVEAPAASAENASTTDKSAGKEKLGPVPVLEPKEKTEMEKLKSTDMKMPVVEHSDGVIHFILGELLSYKDVEDSETTSSLFSKTKESPSPDVEMTNGQTNSPAALSTTSNGDQPKKLEKPEFKAENHTIYIYRCFLLQCLTELLSCYNRTKVEFINFKRKADPQGTTPSKPRSFVLNYLLNSVIPTGTLSHAEDVPSRKRSITSSWAMSVVVSLCSKTGERGYNRPPREFKDYEEEPDLLFVRKFVLEHAIRSFRDAQSSNSEGLEQKYSRLLNLADLFHRMLTGKPNAGSSNNGHVTVEMLLLSQGMLAKIMYEKNFISALTSSIADIDLNFPGAKRAVKYILRPLKFLTKTANELSAQSDHPIAPATADDDEISSDSDLDSSRDLDDTREETPDLFRNSALGILDPGREEDTDSDEEDDDDDEEMYEDEYADEMDYDEEIPIHDHDEVVSDEEAEITEMGPIEGLPGDIGMDIEVEMGGEIDDDMSDSEDDSDDMDEDDEDLDEDVDDVEELEEIDEDGGGSIGADDEDWGTDDGDGEDYPGQDEIEDDQDPTGLEQLNRMLQAGGGEALLQGLEEGEFDPGNPHVQDYIEDDMPEEGMWIFKEVSMVILTLIADEEEDEEDFEEELAFEPELDGVFRFRDSPLPEISQLMRADDDELEIRGMPWGWEGDPHARHHHHHHHMHGHPGAIRARHEHAWGGGMFPGGNHDRIFPPTYRSHRPVGGQTSRDDGTNPLLQRQGRHGNPLSGRRRGEMSDWVAAIDPGPRPDRLTAPNDGPISFIHNLINMMSAGGPNLHHPGQTLHITVGAGVPLPFPGGPLPRELEAAIRISRDRRTADLNPGRSSRDDPTHSVAFIPTLTTSRWQEEARLLFHAPAEKATLIINSILKLLVPPAIVELKRHQKEEAERKEKQKIEREAAAKAKEEAEKREQEEREAKEKKEAEEREAAEAEAAAAQAQQVEASEDVPAEPAAEVEQMEGVQQTQPTIAPEVTDAGPSEPVQRVVTTIRGREIDITELGIDLEYLEALPEEFREEVLMQQVAQQRQNAAASGQEPSEISPEFLEALPAEIRDELLQQEAAERRRREREELRRRAAANGGAAATAAAPQPPEDVDPATFFAALDPNLRASLLMESDEDLLANLPAEMQAEARALVGHRRLDHYVDMPRMGRGRGLDRPDPAGEQAQKRKPTQYVQILDKAGVATLLRLMFIPQQGSAKQSLNGILRDVCQNKQNRAEVVSILLSILQDGSNDINAVERSFAHLTLRAKQPSTQRTPQPKRATPEISTNAGEMSPLMVVQQCLNTLEFLVSYNPRIAEFFLTEHETGSGFKSKSARKGKGKETKASRYPLNALLSLLDRKLVIESSPVMEQLAALLQKITHPLVVLLKKEKEKDKPAKDQKTSESEPAVSTESAPEDPTIAPVDVEMTSATPELSQQENSEVVDSTGAAVPSGDVVTGGQDNEKASEQNDDKAKKHRTLAPPEVPEVNLRLIINIIAARECASKTFKDTLSLITNLSTIPEAKEIFGQELIRQAQDLGQCILNDLEELSVQISKATDGTDVQGMALARFSPASADQTKLLRTITALDFLFDPKRSDSQDKPSITNLEGMESQQKEDILTTLYENSTFASLWTKLSECLTAIRKQGTLFNVANILLPLIEVLMVVCKNTTLKDAPIAKGLPKEFALASPEPEGREARMENLFFTFTEEHRKVLNELVRHSPKLMSGSFSLLVKNSKVLEFDNKRNFFNRKLHTRHELRQPHPSLQLGVRREQVFLDSFRSLYYKKPDEFKYGKLSIRFSGEEGVDAGGVTREWFQVLTKQMFDPNYALFNPVASDRTTFHPNPLSGVNEQHLTFFKFIGRVIGKALYEGRVLDCHFSRAVYKRILGRAISVKDMESLDLEYYKSLLWILENDITDIITETFCVETEAFGETKIVDLMEGGRDIPVTEDNKQDYVRLVVEHKMIGSVKEQLEYFLEGERICSSFSTQLN
jgi:E3 ubiquitin-protein ligase HUWE1